eukprot:scaffold397_cov403-Prasinococcus_capsulatus_cf.AAC.6
MTLPNQPCAHLGDGRLSSRTAARPTDGLDHTASECGALQSTSPDTRKELPVSTGVLVSLKRIDASSSINAPTFPGTQVLQEVRCATRLPISVSASRKYASLLVLLVLVVPPVRVVLGVWLGGKGGYAAPVGHTEIVRGAREPQKCTSQAKGSRRLCAWVWRA